MASLTEGPEHMFFNDAANERMHRLPRKRTSKSFLDFQLVIYNQARRFFFIWPPKATRTALLWKFVQDMKYA